MDKQASVEQNWSSGPPHSAPEDPRLAGLDLGAFIDSRVRGCGGKENEARIR